MNNILIIANARRKGGLSGSDNIYENLAKGFNTKQIHTMVHIDFKPFFLCYCYRIVLSIFRACMDTGKNYSYVYSASDFLMDCLPALVYKRRKIKWVASFYLYAPKENFVYYWSQKVAYCLIKKYADVVCITNDSMKWGFMDKKTVSVNGGVDLSLAGLSSRAKKYDVVFCGRIHPTKGIDEMIKIWQSVLMYKPDAKLAIIGDGDMGIDYIKEATCNHSSITFLGYMAEERFKIYKQSKVVIYPTPIKHDHFSMSPIEAMACGCPCVSFRLPCMEYVKPIGILKARDIKGFATLILALVESFNRDGHYYRTRSSQAYEWAKTWDWKARRKQVVEDIENNLNDNILSKINRMEKKDEDNRNRMRRNGRPRNKGSVQRP